MSLASTLADDILMFADNWPLTVTFQRRTSADTYAAGVSVTGVIREDLASGTLSAGGAVLPQGSVAFHLQARQITGAAPRFGDRVTDSDGLAYSVDSSSSLAEQTHYRVVCIPEVLV